MLCPFHEHPEDSRVSMGRSEEAHVAGRWSGVRVLAVGLSSFLCVFDTAVSGHVTQRFFATFCS